jgi:hypothetical protein
MEFVFVENVKQVFDEALMVPEPLPPPSTNGKSGIKTPGKKAGVKAAKKALAKKR